jgi:hypothetical protein
MKMLFMTNHPFILILNCIHLNLNLLNQNKLKLFNCLFKYSYICCVLTVAGRLHLL